ncbi:GNAT family N-acetyltransferase [Alkalicoccobacillus porphyridii]|uniref:GNAT family N-acetyltransferase n=1 Tax=Alkalicoccobacillus porphyridii TaxID=2597270 RepID=A0A553ZX01_9BACI|nr:GNAT family N-acetyltransferase [Alkalicoccobacillus porphyridii]TSB45973.1 GNAT family N-acetyltransferase [Alkalicoccobacillus porphyridii]
MYLEKISQSNRIEVVSFFEKQWGTDEMVISSGVYHCATLNGFVYKVDSAKVIGLITYVQKGEHCEIISLDSIKENQGIGSKLLEAVENIAKEKACASIQLVTTNDNLDALRFYQKRGYRLKAILSDAVTRARKQKPTIPYIGNGGIPLIDELLLIKTLNDGDLLETK